MGTAKHPKTAAPLALILVASLGLAGCEEWTIGTSEPIVDQRRSLVLDGVKLIDADIGDGESPATYRQERYALSPTARLLLRLEGLDQHLEEIRTEASYRVELLVTPAPDTDLTRAREALRLCPMARNWMMLASWRRAHPAARGRWSRDGGDFRETECVSATVDAAANRALVFDITSWLVSYPRGRGVNYGFALVASEPATVIGDLDGLDAPLMRWFKTTARPEPGSESL